VGILYEERGRGFLCNRGTKTWIAADGTRHELPVTNPDELLKSIKENDWNEYHVIAKANHLTHRIRQDDRRGDRLPEGQAGGGGAAGVPDHAGMGEMTVQLKEIKLKKAHRG
jgi:hypothetical protein